MRRNGWPRHSLRRPRFPKRQMYFHYRVTFTGYVRCFCATTSHDLVTLTFWPWGCFTYSASHVWPTYQFLLSYDYRLLSGYEWLNLITLPLTGTVIAHAPCHVTYHPRAKMVHISEIPNRNLPIHFVTFRALRRSLSQVIGENSVYPIVKATKFTAHAQYHVTCA